MCRSRQVVPGTRTLLLGMPTTQLTTKLCCIVKLICIVCMTSEIMMDDSFNGGMNNILPNSNYVSLNIIDLQDIWCIDGIGILYIYTSTSSIPAPVYVTLKK